MEILIPLVVINNNWYAIKKQHLWKSKPVLIPLNTARRYIARWGAHSVVIYYTATYPEAPAKLLALRLEINKAANLQVYWAGFDTRQMGYKL